MFTAATPRKYSCFPGDAGLSGNVKGALTLEQGRATQSPPIAPPSMQPAQPAAAEGTRQPPIPSICLPTCSDGLTRVRENWRSLLINAVPPVPSASDHRRGDGELSLSCRSMVGAARLLSQYTVKVRGHICDRFPLLME